MNARRYQSPAAFKQGLEQRLRTVSTSGFDFSRRRQLVVFERFLARVVIELGDAVTLKGGLAIEIRIERARTTKRAAGPRVNPRDLTPAQAPALGEGRQYLSFSFRVRLQSTLKVLYLRM